VLLSYLASTIQLIVGCSLTIPSHMPVASSLHLSSPLLDVTNPTRRMSTFRVTLKVVGDGVDPVAIGFVRVPLDASLAVNTL